MCEHSGWEGGYLRKPRRRPAERLPSHGLGRDSRTHAAVDQRDNALPPANVQAAGGATSRTEATRVLRQYPVPQANCPSAPTVNRKFPRVGRNASRNMPFRNCRPLGGFVGLFERLVEKSDYFHYFPVLGINTAKIFKYCHSGFPNDLGLENIRCLNRRLLYRRDELRTQLPASCLIDPRKMHSRGWTGARHHEVHVERCEILTEQIIDVADVS